MRRRDLITAAPATAALAAAAPALAGGGGGGASLPILNLAGVGLPVIAGGRVRNYIFMSLRLHLAANQDPSRLRVKEPFFRDALVRAAHRTPFTLENNWNSLNVAAISAALLRASPAIAGAGAVVRVEVVTQAARRQVTVTR